MNAVKSAAGFPLGFSASTSNAGASWKERLVFGERGRTE